MNFTDSEVQAAFNPGCCNFICSCSSGVFKALWERYFHRFKLEVEYKNDQRNITRETISKHKVLLFNAASI